MGEILSLAAIGAGKGALDTAGNALLINQQKKAQSALQSEQNEFQSQENAKDRAWQDSSWLNHFLLENEEYARRLNLQNEQWLNQFNIQNAYNNPSAQMSRLLAAGINPGAMMQNSGLASLGEASSSLSSGSVSSPSTVIPGSHATSPASAPSFGGLSSTVASFSSIAQMAESIAKVKKTGADVKRIEELLPHEVENIIQDSNVKRETSLLTEIQKNVAFAWSDKKSAAEFNKLVADSYFAYSNGDLNKANELVAMANERLVSLESEIKVEQRPQLLANLKELQNVYKTEQKRNVSAAHASEASAEASLSSSEFSKEMSETERQLREGKVTEQILENGLRRLRNQLTRRENLRDIKTNDYQVWQIIENAKKAGYLSAEALENWKIAVKDNNSYVMRLILDAALKASPNVVVPLK